VYLGLFIRFLLKYTILLGSGGGIKFDVFFGGSSFGFDTADVEVISDNISSKLYSLSTFF
jgi:hypothetical protein